MRAEQGARRAGWLALVAVAVLGLALNSHGQTGDKGFGADQNGSLVVRFDDFQCDNFVPLGIYEVRVRIEGPVNLSALGVELFFPDGWGVDSIGGACAPDIQQVNTTDNLIQLAWSTIPPEFLPCEFSVFFIAPAGASVDQLFSLQGLYRAIDSEEQLETEQRFFIPVPGGPCIGGVSCAAGGSRGAGDTAVAGMCILLLSVAGLAVRRLG